MKPVDCTAKAINHQIHNIKAKADGKDAKGFGGVATSNPSTPRKRKGKGEAMKDEGAKNEVNGEDEGSSGDQDAPQENGDAENGSPKKKAKRPGTTPFKAELKQEHD